MDTQHKGKAGEDRALQYLLAQGLKLVARNFRSRYGEIDLIMQDRDTLAFIEVRMRRSNAYGGAASSITHTKKRRLIQTAHTYLMQLSPIPPCRFDAITVEGEALCWLQNVFDAC